MTSQLTLQDVLETIRVTCGEQDCDVNQITAQVLHYAAEQIDDKRIRTLLEESADEMDRPVELSDIMLSLQQWGVR